MVATLTAVFSPQEGQGIFTKADGSMLYGMGCSLSDHAAKVNVGLAGVAGAGAKTAN